MLEINLFRVEKGGDPEKIRESQRRRYSDPAIVDTVIALDEDARKLRFQGDRLRTEMNAMSKEFGRLMKAKEDVGDLGSKVAELKKEIARIEEETKVTETERDTKLREIGNIVHDDVPVSDNEDNNRVERQWGDVDATAARLLTSGAPAMNHVDLLYMIGGVEYERGVSVAGNRGYFLTGPGVLLSLALTQFGTKSMVQKGFTPVQTPYFMEKDAMAKCAQLDDFDEQLYKVTGDGPEKYLIATSEQPLCAYHANEWVETKALPRRFLGVSTCFRKETGSHGRDTLGIFRVHQFDKLEQFVVTAPTDNTSWDEMKTMINNAEEFYQALKIPYRVVSIVSGELNNAAAMKYDLEGWYPASTTFRELVSCSNCTDYQARRLETRYGTKKMGELNKQYVHMLNSTLCAVTRVVCAILENYQEKDGVRVPEVLVPFVGTDFFPFVRPAQAPPKPSKKEKKSN